MTRAWILEALEETQISASPLLAEQVSQLLNQIRERFTSHGTFSSVLWEALQDCSSLWLPDGWERIRDCPISRPILLYEEARYRYEAFEFETIEDAVTILGNTPGFEFYITNAAVEFVICHNDHDYLIGAGTAKSWIEALDAPQT